MQEGLRRGDARGQGLPQRLLDHDHRWDGKGERGRFRAASREAHSGSLDAHCHGVHATHFVSYSTLK